MSGADFLLYATTIALALLLIGAIVTIVRVLIGPTMPDRVLSLDLLTTIGIAILGVYTVRTGFTPYLDVAIALGLVGFLSTIALTRYLLSRVPPSNQLDFKWRSQEDD